jgi:hypothetical protein
VSGYLDLFSEAVAWFDWSYEQRSDLLYRISQIIFALRDTAPDDPPPEQWPAILRAWLAGVSTTQMVTDPEISPFTTSPNTLCLLIENLCGYLMPWGLNSILMHLTAVAAELRREIPSVCSYFAGMTKYGVAEPAAVCITPYLDHDRALAIRAAAVCPFGFEKPDDVVRWILNVTEAWLIDHGLEPDIARGIIQKRDLHRHPRSRSEGRRTYPLEIQAGQEAASKVALGDKILVIPAGRQNTREFRVFTLPGVLLGNYGFETEAIPDWWGTPHFVDAEVASVSRKAADSWAIAISMVEL